MPVQTERRTGPLNGFKILDFTRALAGPFGTMLLADLGATVIKIEAPDGDFIRGNGPFLHEDGDGGLGGFFSSINRNKKSVVLNLKNTRAQEIARQLAKECDAVIMNFSSPRIMEKYNLGYERLHEINPSLVYVAISGYGTNRVVGSEKENAPTVDMMIQACSGIMSITGANEDEMYKVGPGIGDTYPGTLAIVALLAALIHARETGEGQYVEVAMLDALMLLCERMLYQYSYTGKVPKPIGNNHPLHAPWGIYKTKDGYISIAAHPVKYWDHLINAMDMDELRQPEFATVSDRVTNQKELNRVLESWTSVRTKQECMEIFDRFDCLCAPVNTAEDLFNSSQVKKREMLVEVEGDARTGEKVIVAGTPFKLSATPARIYRRAPLLSEDTAEVLEQLGYTQDEIKKLDEEGATRLR